ncbi:hypothetical protein B5S29_g4705 [[Candida] boidinii]|nr:hypothetical protein B5S29_g4705 [[Candida] boidinii]
MTTEATSTTQVEMKDDEPLTMTDKSIVTNHEIDVAPASASDSDSPFELPEHTKVYFHLNEYPFIHYWIRLHNSNPLLPHLIRPQLYRLVYSEPLRDYTIVIDEQLDCYLERLDELVPALKTVTMNDITENVITNPLITTTENLEKLSNDTVNNLRSTAEQIRKSYAPIYDNKGKAILRSQLDPMIIPVNSRLESFINNRYEPIDESDVIPDSDKVSNELDRSIIILSKGLTRGFPILQKRLNSWFYVTPRETMNSIQETYNKSKELRGDGQLAPIIASVDTSIQITTDALRNLMNFNSEKKEKKEDEEKDIVVSTEENKSTTAKIEITSDKTVVDPLIF